MPTPKTIELYVVIAVLTGGSFILTSSNAGVTQDKIEAIEQRIEKLESQISGVIGDGSNHEKLFAHPGIFERTNQQQNDIDALDERLQYWERLMVEWGK